MECPLCRRQGGIEDAWLDDLQAYCLAAVESKNKCQPIPFESVLALISEIRHTTNIAIEAQRQVVALRKELHGA